MAILINDNTARVQYTATSGQTTFAVPFEFFENSDLKVYRNSTLQTIATHYTLTGAGVTGGGNLTFVSGVTLNDVITIVRDIPIKRVTDFPLSGPFNITALNLQLDQLTAMIQEVNTLVTTRVPLLAEFDQPSTFSTIPTRASRANKYFVFDSNGNPAVALGTSAFAVGPITDAYASQGSGYINFGYGQEGVAAIRIGANDAFNATGVLQVGGAGQFDGGNGSYISNDGHPNWNVVQSSIPFNPTEWNIYGNGVGGAAISNGTTTITRSTGIAWGSFMNGLFLWFDGVAYTVVSATANSAVLTSAPPAKTACWQFVYTTGSGTCTVSGSTVTRVSGDPFIPSSFGSGFTFFLNNNPYTVTASTNSNTCSISSPPGNGTYSYRYITNINNQVATLRLQLTAGADEENLSFYATPFAYEIGAQQSGVGTLRNFRFNSEYQAVVEMAAYGKFVSLGGIQNSEAARFLWLNNAVNRFDFQGATTGVSPAVRARGSDTNVGLGYDTKGTGSHVFTSNAFSAVNFKVFGSNQPDYLTVDAGNGVVPLAAEGGSTNVDIRLIPKGTGAVRLGTVVRFGAFTSNADAPINGYVTIVDDAGNTRKLATIA
jgi:hypothetical protein